MSISFKEQAQNNFFKEEQNLIQKEDQQYNEDNTDFDVDKYFNLGDQQNEQNIQSPLSGKSENINHFQKNTDKYVDQIQLNNQSLSTFDTEQNNQAQYYEQEKQLSRIEEITDSNLDLDFNQNDAIQGDQVLKDDEHIEDKKLQEQKENKQKGDSDFNQYDAMQGDQLLKDDENIADKKLLEQKENKQKGGKKKFKLSNKIRKLIQQTYKILTELGILEILYSSLTQINNHKYLQDHTSKIDKNLYEALQGISEQRKFTIKKKWPIGANQKKGSFNNCTYRITDEFICKFKKIFDKLDKSN